MSEERISWREDRGRTKYGIKSALALNLPGLPTKRNVEILESD